ncbi:MAG TPA: AMP-binding protein, partial [Anaerolineae bacterium]|nr:AMP-binding protein [Anaerolineae bacterium]
MYFGIPGIGAVLHTINPSLAPDDLAYTLMHAEDEVLIFNEDFAPLVERVRPRLPSIRKYIMITDKPEKHDVYMPLTPMFHVHAWGIPYMSTLFGVKQVYPGRYQPEMLLKLILGEKVTFSHCVPTILQMLVTAPAVQGLDLSRWQVVIGGARLPKGLALAARKLGVKVYTGYGMSETCPILTIATLKPSMDEDTHLDYAISTGFPVPLVNLKVLNAAGQEVARDATETGEIVVRTPWLTPGYYKDPERSEELWAGGWLHTGDVAHVDEQGYVQIVDRMKD